MNYKLFSSRSRRRMKGTPSSKARTLNCFNDGWTRWIKRLKRWMRQPSFMRREYIGWDGQQPWMAFKPQRAIDFWNKHAMLARRSVKAVANGLCSHQHHPAMHHQLQWSYPPKPSRNWYAKQSTWMIHLHQPTNQPFIENRWCRGVLCSGFHYRRHVCCWRGWQEN